MNPAVPPIASNSVLLHIGPHKTGTTSIQRKLAAARRELGEHGITYPGRHGAHHVEARAFLGRPEGFSGDGPPLKIEAWNRLARIARETAGTVVLSSEFFSWSSAADRTRLVEEIGGERVHLLLAARNPGALALSNWQQSVRSGNPASISEWLEARFSREQPGVGGSNFWATADAAEMVADWSDVVDPSRIHVVIVDESDHGLIPATFEQLLGLPAGLIANQPIDEHNRSLTAPEVELVRAASALVKDELTWDEYSLFFRRGIGRQLLYTRTPERSEARSTLPLSASVQASAEVESIIARLLDSGVQIIGDVAHLRDAPPAADPSPVTQVPVELAAHAAVGVMKAAQARIRRAEARIEKLESELANLRRPDPDPRFGRLAARVRRVLRRG